MSLQNKIHGVDSEVFKKKGECLHAEGDLLGEMIECPFPPVAIIIHRFAGAMNFSSFCMAHMLVYLGEHEFCEHMMMIPFSLEKEEELKKEIAEEVEPLEEGSLEC